MKRWRGTMSKAESDRRHNLFRGHIGQIRGHGWRMPIIAKDGRYAVIGPVTIIGTLSHRNDNAKET